MKLVSGHHVCSQRLDQWRQKPARSTHPFRQGRAIDLHPFACVDLRLAVARKIIAVLRDQHVRQKSRAGDTPLDRPAGREGLYDAVATGTAQLRSNLAYHFDSLGHVL